MGLKTERYWLGNSILYLNRDDVPAGVVAAPVLVTEVSYDALASYPDWFEVVGQNVENRHGGKFTTDGPPQWSRETHSWIVPVRDAKGSPLYMNADRLQPAPKTLTKTIRLTGAPEIVESVAQEIARVVARDLRTPLDITVEVDDDE